MMCYVTAVCIRHFNLIQRKTLLNCSLFVELQDIHVNTASLLRSRSVRDLFAIILLRSNIRCVGDVDVGKGQEALDVCLTNQEVRARLNCQDPQRCPPNTIDSYGKHLPHLSGFPTMRR